MMEDLMARFDLTDFEWCVIQPLLPNKPRGVPRVGSFVRKPGHERYLGAAENYVFRNSPGFKSSAASKASDAGPRSSN
jgi:transposase